MIRIEQLKIDIAPDEEAKRRLEKKLGRAFGCVPDYQIVRRALDARDKKHLLYVYTVDISLEQETVEQRFVRKYKGPASLLTPVRYAPPHAAGKPARVVVVGAGPAGLFASLLLAEAGVRPLLIEQGAPVEERTRDVEAFWNGGSLKPYSNVQFGEGGAGTFSDGKLSTGIRDASGRIRFVLETFVKAGAPEKILWEAKPHIGTDVLYDVVKGLRERILAAGGDILFHTRMNELVINGGRLSGLSVQNTETGEFSFLPADAVILAPGHSARECFGMLYRQGVQMESKSFAVGIRIQHPQKLINAIQYGSDAPDFLPAADYKLTAHTSSGRGVYSFCMCPGGEVVNASSEDGGLCVNGMSRSARAGENANAALVVQVGAADFPEEGLFGGILFQKKLEIAAYCAGEGRIPLQLWKDFAEKQRSDSLGEVSPAVRGGWNYADLNEVLSPAVSDALREAMPLFDRKMPGFAKQDALLCGVESRTSSPIRLLRDEKGESNIKGLFPCGEGAGYAGGIMSAAVDGMKAAEAVLAAFL